jgi:hypothetical protein
MDKRVTITTREGEGREKDIMKTSPMAISFGKNLKMTVAVDKVKLKFKRRNFEMRRRNNGV